MSRFNTLILRRILIDVEEQLDKGVHPTVIINGLVSDHSTLVGFSAGAHSLRVCGVTGTATASMSDALKSWVRCAHRKLAREGQA